MRGGGREEGQGMGERRGRGDSTQCTKTGELLLRAADHLVISHGRPDSPPSPQHPLYDPQ